MSCSSETATSSTMVSRRVSTSSAMSSGTGPSLVPPLVVEEIGLVLQDVDHTLEVFLGPDGQILDIGLDAELVADAGKGHLEVGPVAVHFVDEENGGQAQFGHFAPELFRERLDAVHGIHHEDHRVHCLEQDGDVAVEAAVTRDIEEKMPVLVVLEGGQTGLGAAPAFDFLGLVVERRLQEVDLVLDDLDLLALLHLGADARRREEAAQAGARGANSPRLTFPAGPGRPWPPPRSSAFASRGSSRCARRSSS